MFFECRNFRIQASRSVERRNAAETCREEIDVTTFTDPMTTERHRV